jgi:hypothetical protein
MKIALFVFSWALMISTVWGNSDLMSITSKDGKTIQVELNRSTETEVTLKMVKDGRNYTFKLDKLDAASQEKIKEWKKAGGGASVSYEIDYSSGKSNRPSTDYYYDDDRRLILKPKVTIKNRDSKVATKKARVTVLILGRPVRERNVIRVLQKQDRELPVIEPLSESVIEIDSVVTQYDNKGSYKSGTKYLGYVVLIHDGKSRILASKSIPSTLVQKYGPMLLGLKEGYRYDKNMKVMKSTRPTRYYR